MAEKEPQNRTAENWLQLMGLVCKTFPEQVKTPTPVRNMLHVSAQDSRCLYRQFFSFSQFTDLPLSSGLCKNRAAKHTTSKLQQLRSGIEIC